MDRLTIPEYELLMEGVRLKQIDKDYRNHLQAFLNFVVKSEKRVGKNKSRPVYNTFKKFYDYEKEVEKTKEHGEGKSKLSGIGKFLKKGV